MHQIDYSEQAEADLVEIYMHYAKERNNPQKAEDVINAIRKKMKTVIALTPGIGKNFKANIKSFPVEKEHRVFYQISGNIVKVSRVLATRAIKNWEELEL